MRELEKDLVSHGRIISHMRTEREKSAIACRMITSQQARECAGLRKKLKQVGYSCVFSHAYLIGGCY